MPDIVNPYIAGNPVTGTEMFFGRDDVFTFVQQALMGQHRDNVIVLYGQRRTGKTSVLYQMHRHLDPRYLCIFIDLHGLALEGLNGFIWELANTIARALRKDYQIELPRLKNRAEFMADARNSFENDFLQQVWSVIGDRHVLLMLDEAIRLQEQIQAGKLENEVFEYLRHLMQHHEHLNFLFSLGSGLEEMEKEYAFLFSVGLYKKISFLEREAAIALITQPVKDQYQVAPEAIDRILQITSGHAYYTQLLCHSLFSRWQQIHQPQIAVKDVDAILDEVVERGLAVLKHVWEESTPGEKAVLAGLAAAMGDRNRPIGPQEIDRAWAQHAVTLPESERSKAIQSLIARDVIVGRDKYEFAIDLQRLWVEKYERLEWVKEEIASDVQRWQSRPGAQPKSRSFWRTRNALIVTAAVWAVFLILVILLVQSINTGHQGSIYRQTLEAQVALSSKQLRTAEVAVTEAANAPAATATAAAQQLQLAQLNATAAVQACPQAANIQMSDLTQGLFDRINALRSQQGLAALAASDQLTAAARSHTQDMANTGNVTNVGPSYITGPVGQLIYVGCTPDDALTWWLNSQVHRDMLLSPQYTKVGLAAAASNGVIYYTIVLGTQTVSTVIPSVQPTSTPTLNNGLPIVKSFAAEPPAVVTEQSTNVRLSWIVANADVVSISELGTFAATGSTQIRPPASGKTYTLTATNKAGTVRQQIAITVLSKKTYDIDKCCGEENKQISPNLDFNTQIETQGPLELNFHYPATICSDIRLHILLDGVEVRTTDYLGPNAGVLETGLIDLGPVTPGAHKLTLRPEGRPIGCNSGTLGGWGGTVDVYTSPSP